MPDVIRTAACLLALTAAASAQQTTEEYLASHSREYVKADNSDEATFRSRTNDRPPPQTYLASYMHGLKRHAAKLLTESQTKRLVDLIENASSEQHRWHDERNFVRCAWERQLWSAAAQGQSWSDTTDSLTTLMRLRMEWTRQEEMNRWGTTRDFWNLLTQEQQSHIVNGDWKPYAKLNMGHSRGDFLKKKLIRVLGKPADGTRFEKLTAKWTERRRPLHEKYLAARDRVVLTGFHLDHSSDALMHDAVRRQNEAYARLYLAEAEAMLQIIVACYADSANVCNAEATRIWSEAREKYTDSRPGLAESLEHEFFETR